MFDWIRHRVLRLLRVPAEPDPPFGAPTSVRVFRASRKLFQLRLVGWSVTQFLALAAIIFWMTVVLATEHEAQKAHQEARQQRRAQRPLKPGKHRSFAQAFEDVAGRVPMWIFLPIWIVKGLSLVVYLGQIAVTYTAIRLDYEMRWYMVTDRSLRIRSGLWKVEEMTMSFANLQQVTVSQGPLQRFFGIADLRVQSAGGGGGGDPHGQQGPNMHTGIFRGVDNAPEIRDLILERLRQFRETGLGDPDEIRQRPFPAVQSADPDTLTSARQLLEEARRLKLALAPRNSDQF